MHSCSAGQKHLAQFPFINNSNIYLFSPSEHYLGVTDVTALCGTGARGRPQQQPQHTPSCFWECYFPLAVWWWWLESTWHQRNLCWEPLAEGTVLRAGTETSSQHGWKPWGEGSWVQAHFRLDWENYWVSLCLSILEVMAKLRSSVFQNMHSYWSIQIQTIHTPFSYNQYTCPASADTHFRPTVTTAHSLCHCPWKRALLQAAGTQPQHACHAQQQWSGSNAVALKRS